MSIDFIQKGPRLLSALDDNYILKSVLKHFIASKNLSSILNEVGSFEQKIITKIENIGRSAELNPPELVKYSPWGELVDEIKVSAYWHELHKFCAEEGLISDGYHKIYADDSRLMQFAKLYLFHPSSAFYSCPLAMTDGAAKVLEFFKNENDLFKNAFDHLVSNDPEKFWTSGQWMTEKTGGSDVSQTSTTARKDGDGYILNGIKWFSSATTSEMALGLARIIDDNGRADEKLSLFFIPMRQANGKLNGIEVLRLKDKLGTKALPTAELKLQNCKAYLIGPQGKGVKTVSMMLNITRIYNSVCSVAHMERCINYFEDYSKSRQAFDQKLIDQPLQVQLLAHLKCLHFSATALTFHVTKLLGQSDMNLVSESESKLLRLLTPLAKMYTAKLAVHTASETVEGIGGVGYIEDSKIPVLLRDAQVFPIWEGATNVLSLDLLRVIADQGLLKTYFEYCDDKMKTLKKINEDVFKSFEIQYLKLKGFFKTSTNFKSTEWQSSSRDLAWSMAEVFSVIVMVEIVNTNKTDQRLMALTQLFVENMNIKLDQNYESRLKLSQDAM